jgi:glycosyltransferase involved in cell wall biosynthesis
MRQGREKTKPMHIGFLTTEYPDIKSPQGGLGNYTRKAALDLVRGGHHVTIFVLTNKKGILEDPGIQFKYVSKTKFHYRIKRISFLTNWLDLYELWLNARRLRQAVLAYHQSFPLDIVQTSSYLFPGYLLCHNTFFPLVCRCSSYSPLTRSANGVQRELTDAIYDWMEARLVSESDSAYAPSKFIANIYERFEAVKLCVIHTPVELPNFKLDDSVYKTLADGRRYLLYFGTLNGVKGVDILIQALPEILSLHKNLSFFFIGPNHRLPGGIKAVDRLKSILGTYLQEGRVVYSPSLPKTQLYPLIQNAIGVVMPSRVDNFPNACLEAFSLGVPVIGTRHSSLDELIDDGVNGFLAENGDTGSLQVAINKLLIQTSQQHKRMKKSIQQTMERMHQEDSIGKLLKFYKDVVQNYSRVKN